MCLVNNDSKPLILKIRHTVHNIWKLLNRRSNDLCIAVQSNGKVSRYTLVIHHTNQTSLMLHAHDGFLKLPIYNNSVCNNNNIVKDNLVVGIMQ